MPNHIFHKKTVFHHFLFTTYKKVPSLTKIRERYEELLKLLLEEQEKLKKINKRIKKIEIIGRTNIKEKMKLVKIMKT